MTGAGCVKGPLCSSVRPLFIVLSGPSRRLCTVSPLLAGAEWTGRPGAGESTI
jgi:hypothetical protein